MYIKRGESIWLQELAFDFHLQEEEDVEVFGGATCAA